MLQLDASIGVAVCPDHAADFETLLKHADTAMYVAKRNRTRVEVHDAGREQQHSSRLALAADLRRRIDAASWSSSTSPSPTSAIASAASRRSCAGATPRGWCHPTRSSPWPSERLAPPR